MTTYHLIEQKITEAKAKIQFGGNHTDDELQTSYHVGRLAALLEVRELLLKQSAEVVS